VVATIDGITYVNDSIATSPERSMAALRAIDSPIVLIAGGRDKHTPMEDWARLMKTNVRAVVLVGEAAPLIREALAAADVSVPILSARRFVDTLALASSVAQPGDTVLLSPGCTSFDEFRDYEARGAAFRELVDELSRARSNNSPSSMSDGAPPRSI
jgi:UDP-N-acetylmuramoylalanine--D-glutamate ligase